MRLSISEKERPQDYYLQSGVDSEGNPIYDLPNEDTTDYAPAKALRKKCFDGNADIVLLADTIQVYWKGLLVAEAQLEGQVETSPGVWDGQLFSFQDANIQKITEVEGEDSKGNPVMVPVTPFYRFYEVKDIPALGIMDGVFGLDVHWAFGDKKFAFYLDPPGFNSRIRWQCRVKDSAVAWTDNSDPENPIYHKGLFFSVSDYPGEVNHGSMPDPEPGWTIHWWTFEPNGKLIDPADSRTPKERYEQGVGLVVDPYLSIDEQSGYIDVLCDGYLMSFDKGSAGSYNNDFILYNKAKTTPYFYERSHFHDDSAGLDYMLAKDENRVHTILENTPGRIKIRIKGRMDSTGGAGTNYLANLDSVEKTYTIYPDHYIIRSVWVASGSVVVTDTNDYCKVSNMNNSPYVANLTNESGEYETDPTETACSNYTAYNSANYLVMTADEFNWMMIELYKENFSIDQWHDTAGQINFSITADLSANTYIHISAHIIDSAVRKGSAKIYSLADRLDLGDQYKDPILDQAPLKGDDVTDMIFPARISSGTLHADGAHHYEPDGNDEVQLTLDRIRIRPSIVIHDWPFQYGSVSNPTDILLNHLKMDDNAANNDLLAEVGPDGDWLNVSDGSARNTNTSGDSVAAGNFRGRALDTQDGAGYASLAVGSGTVHDNDFFKKGSALIKITPQFAYNDGTNQRILTLSVVAGTDYMVFEYLEASDILTMSVSWNNNNDTIYYPAFSENYSLQRRMYILVFWDSNKDIFGFAMDGQIVDYRRKTDVPTSSHPAYFLIASNESRTLPADIIIDEIKTFSECVLAGGAFNIGNGAGLLADINNPHKDLCFFWDAQSVNAKGASNLATSKTGTLGSGNSGGSTSFPTSGGIVGGYFDNESNGANYYIYFSVSSSDIFPGSKGAVGIWVNWQALGSWDQIFGFGDATTSLTIGINDSNYIYSQITLNAGSDNLNVVSTYAPTVGKWYWVVNRWDVGKNRNDIYITGKPYIGTDTTAESWTHSGSGSLYIGANRAGTLNTDCFIGRVFISKDPDTPEIWTAFGKPLHMPLKYSKV